MTSSPKQRLAVIATEKITKKQIDQTLAEGKTHVKFKSNKVQRRLLKEQERIRRLREVRENKFKAAQKAAAKARQTTQGGGIGLAHPHADMVQKTDTAHFIDKSGKNIPVSHEEAQQITNIFEESEGKELPPPPDEVIISTDVSVNIIDGHAGITEDGMALSPFEPESPGNRTQMFSSTSSRVLKVEETKLFQSGLTGKITEEGRNNVEAMRKGLEEAGLLNDSTKQQ